MSRNANHMIAIAGIAFLTVAVCAIPAMSASGVFIKIDGIDGESSDKDHSGWIEVDSFSWEHTGISMSGQRASRAGTRRGEPSMPGSLTITKYTDKASTPLMRACSQGTSLGDVVVEVVETDKITELVQYSIYTLSGVNLSNCSRSDSDDLPAESFKLNYDTVTSKYHTKAWKTGKTREAKP